MSVELDFSDIEKFQKRLEELGRKGSKIENEALIAGAKVINDEIIKNAPERTGKAKTHLKVNPVKKEKGIKVVKVGITREDNSQAFYLKFHEYGTSKMSARPFMRPAFERKKKEALEKTHQVIRKGLGL